MKAFRYPKGCVVALAFLLAVGFGLIFTGTFYTAERRWIAGLRLGEPIGSHPPIRRALGQCISAYDRTALAAFDATGSYRTSGWFLSEDRQSAVIRCMSAKGWLLMPVKLYSF